MEEPTRATGADQIAMLQRVLHQLLGGHVDHVVVAVDDVVQLRLHALYHQLRGIVPVKPVELGVDQIFQVFHGVFDFGREQVVGARDAEIRTCRRCGWGWSMTTS